MPRIRMDNLNDVEMVHSLYIEKILQIFLVEHVGIFFSYKKKTLNVNGQHVERSNHLIS